MKRILVSGASGIVGYGILKSLRRSGQELFLVGTSIYDDSVAPAFCDLFELAPSTTDPGYIHWLQETLRKHRVDMLIPGIEIDMFRWAAARPAIEATGAIAMLNNLELINYCRDKWTFYQHLMENRMDCAIESSLEKNFNALEKRFGLPFLLKPRQGFGSKGIVRVHNRESFAEHCNDIGGRLMAQPIVGNDNEEYTTSVFGDGEGGHFCAMTLRRKLSRDGFTDKAEVVDTTDFATTIKALCGIFNPIGPTNFQFRMCADGPKLLEINPRVSSSTSIRSAFGYNESAMATEYFLAQRPPSQPTIRRGKAIRYTEEHIFYENRINL